MKYCEPSFPAIEDNGVLRQDGIKWPRRPGEAGRGAETAEAGTILPPCPRLSVLATNMCSPSAFNWVSIFPLVHWHAYDFWLWLLGLANMGRRIYLFQTFTQALRDLWRVLIIFNGFLGTYTIISIHREDCCSRDMTKKLSHEKFYIGNFETMRPNSWRQHDTINARCSWHINVASLASQGSV